MEDEIKKLEEYIAILNTISNLLDSIENTNDIPIIRIKVRVTKKYYEKKLIKINKAFPGSTKL